MKRVIIIHGWDGSPNEPMHSALKEGLEKLGYQVSIPEMPNPEVPEIGPWVSKVAETVGTPDADMHFIGHSIGCQTVLRYLAGTSGEVGKVVLIAPWILMDLEKREQEEGREIADIARPWVKTPIDFEKIQSLTQSITAFFSDDDPFVSLDNQKFFEEKLGAQTFMQHAKGHFNTSEEITEVVPAVLEIFSTTFSHS